MGILSDAADLGIGEHAYVTDDGSVGIRGSIPPYIYNKGNHEIAISAINAYASTIQGKNLSVQEVSDKCAEVYRNTVANLNKIPVDSDGKA